MNTVLADAETIAASVVDPELPMLTLADLGVLRSVEVTDGGRVVVAITPTYTGCPALATMRADLTHRLHAAGFADVEVRIVLDPPWTTDWITDAGRAKLAEAGLSPPGRVSTGSTNEGGPIPLTLEPTRRAVTCPQCGGEDVVLVSEFGATACKAHYRCRTCREPFDHVKEI